MQEKLVHIFYQDAADAVTIREYIYSVERLDELVELQETDTIKPSVSHAFYVNENRIHFLPDWLDKRPAVVFPSEIPFNKNNFLGAIFGLLGNEEKYPQYFTGFPAMLYAFDLMKSLAAGDETEGALEAILSRTNFDHAFENYAFNHNVAIALNYGHFSNEINAEAIGAHYDDALQLAFEPSYKAFTLKYYATFLMDNGDPQKALQLLKQKTPVSLGDYARFSLERVWCQAMMKEIKIPYDESQMLELKTRLWDTLQFFDQYHHKTIAAFLWMDAAHIANLSNSYAESIGYITKAAQYFKEEDQLEMRAQVQMMRGRLLYDWAQSGNPQFYRSALEAYQEALNIFTKDDTPEVFADIHHQLGVIYAELPDENKKRSIWAALSVTSFSEAFEYYNKAGYPYQYSKICNDYGNAFSKFPSGAKSDNFEKALSYYQEALTIRTKEEYPTERALTLLNFLDASWRVGNPDEEFNEKRFFDMLAKANEIKELTIDEQLLAEADKHLQLLEELKTTFNKQVADA